MKYDNGNVFAQIISGKLPAKKLYEDDKLIAIENLYPVAPIHILVIPKGDYLDFNDFVMHADESDVGHYFKMVAKIAAENGAGDYRIVSNKGELAGQSVFHFHTHILSGFDNKNLIDNKL